MDTTCTDKYHGTRKMAVIYTELTRLLHKKHVINNKNETIAKFYVGSDNKL